MLCQEDMQCRLTDLRNGLTARGSSTLKLATSFSGQCRCMIFYKDWNLILNHLRKVNDFAKKLLHPILHAKIKEIKNLFLMPLLGISKKKASTLS